MGGEGEEAGDKEGVEAEVMAKDWLVVHGVGVVLAPFVEGDLGCLREGHLVLILGPHHLLLPRQAQNYNCFSVTFKNPNCSRYLTRKWL